MIINNYLSNVSSKYSNEKHNEVEKLMSIISYLNYSDITNNTKQ